MNTKIKRKSGRPEADSSRDVESTILNIAEKRFAEQGYASTSMRDIADHAGVNPAMIHYYFGNKESLLKAVLERALMPLAAVIESMYSSERSISPGEILETLMSTVASHPFLPYLVMREVMLPGGEMQAYFAKHLAPKLGGALPGLLAREQENKRLQQDVSPQLGALAIMSLAIFPFVVRPVAEKVLDIEMSGDALDQLKLQMSALLNRGMTK